MQRHAICFLKSIEYPKGYKEVQAKSDCFYEKVHLEYSNLMAKSSTSPLLLKQPEGSNFLLALQLLLIETWLSIVVIG